MRRLVLLLATAGSMLALYVGAASAQAAPGETLDANNLNQSPAGGNGVATYFVNGQTFTAEHDGALTSVEVRIARQNSPGDLTVQIANVDAASGLPTIPEDVLATAKLPASEVPQTFTSLDALQIEKITFDTPASVVAGKKYALILKYEGTQDFRNSYVLGAGPYPADTYTGGERIFRVSQFDPANTLGPWRRDDQPFDLIFGIYVTSPDTTPPEVSSTSPSNFATGVAATANISATFFEEGSGIDPDTLTTDSFKVVRVKPTGNEPVSGTLRYDGASQTATFDPSSNLAKGLYQATITTGVEDKAGNALLNDYTWTFATAGPPSQR